MWEITSVVVGIGIAVLGLLVVRRRVPLHMLKEQHEVASVSFAVVGGFYGVLLAFVLVASWERFERTRANTEVEANSVGDLYRQAAAIPEPSSSALRRNAVDYLRSVIEDEWPAMESGTLSPKTQRLYFALWHDVLGMPADDGKMSALFQCMVEKLDDFAEARRYRLLYLQSSLPPVIWYFLLSFGIITVSFTYFFGMPHLLPHLFITFVLAFTIAFTLFIIEEMQSPFSGTVRVPDRAYRVVLSFMAPERAP